MTQKNPTQNIYNNISVTNNILIQLSTNSPKNHRKFFKDDLGPWENYNQRFEYSQCSSENENQGQFDRKRSSTSQQNNKFEDSPQSLNRETLSKNTFHQKNINIKSFSRKNDLDLTNQVQQFAQFPKLGRTELVLQLNGKDEIVDGREQGQFKRMQDDDIYSNSQALEMYKQSILHNINKEQINTQCKMRQSNQRSQSTQFAHANKQSMQIKNNNIKFQCQDKEIILDSNKQQTILQKLKLKQHEKIKLQSKEILAKYNFLSSRTSRQDINNYNSTNSNYFVSHVNSSNNSYANNIYRNNNNNSNNCNNNNCNNNCYQSNSYNNTFRSSNINSIGFNNGVNSHINGGRQLDLISVSLENKKINVKEIMIPAYHISYKAQCNDEGNLSKYGKTLGNNGKTQISNKLNELQQQINQQILASIDYLDLNPDLSSVNPQKEKDAVNCDISLQLPLTERLLHEQSDSIQLQKKLASITPPPLPSLKHSINLNQQNRLESPNKMLSINSNKYQIKIKKQKKKPRQKEKQGQEVVVAGERESIVSLLKKINEKTKTKTDQQQLNSPSQLKLSPSKKHKPLQPLYISLQNSPKFSDLQLNTGKIKSIVDHNNDISSESKAGGGVLPNPQIAITGQPCVSPIQPTILTPISSDDNCQKTSEEEKKQANLEKNCTKQETKKNIEQQIKQVQQQVQQNLQIFNQQQKSTFQSHTPPIPCLQNYRNKSVQIQQKIFQLLNDQQRQQKEKIIHDSTVITVNSIKKNSKHTKEKNANKIFQESLYSKQLAIRNSLIHKKFNNIPI